MIIEDRICFATTAMLRPELLAKTYESFRQHLQGIDLQKTQLFINIDPAPAAGSATAVLDVANQFFGKVTPRLSPAPSFPAAVKWCWQQADTDYLFHLEDDWQLLRPFNVSRAVEVMDAKPNLIQCVLRAYKYDLAGKYAYDKFVLSPHVSRRSFYQRMGSVMTTDRNPEQQLRLHEAARGCGKEVNHIQCTNRILVKDIGRQWLHKSGYKRPKLKYKFTRWITK
jgi:hypothetical protein